MASHTLRPPGIDRSLDLGRIGLSLGLLGEILVLVEVPRIFGVAVRPLVLLTRLVAVALRRLGGSRLQARSAPS